MKRRKCFIFLMIVMAVIYILSGAGVTFNVSEKDFLEIGNGINFYEGKVVEVKHTADKTAMKTRLLRINDKPVKLNGYVLINIYGEIPETPELMNATIGFTALLTLPQAQRNPHCFDYRKYLKSKRIFLTGTIKSYEVYDDIELSIIEKYERVLYRAKERYAGILPENAKGIVLGILFGDTSALDEDVYNQFRTNGTCHVLAVSGLHIGILYSLYKKLFKRKNTPLSLTVLGILLLSYGTLSMWSPSTIRAVLMILMNVAAYEFDLRYDLLTSMSAAGLILIAFNPYVILGASFQMSFLAITSMAFFTPVLPEKIPEGIRTTIAVNLGLLGYQMYNFNYVSVSALIANIPTVFIASYLVPVALIGFAVYSLSGITFPLIKFTEAMAVLLEKVNALSTVNGYGAFQVISPDIPIVLFLSFMLFLICSEYFEIMRLRKAKKTLRRLIFLSIAVSSLMSLIFFSPIKYDDIVFIDVGQGDSVHINSGKTDILIDGGGSTDYNVGEKILKPYLLHNGTKDIDLVIMTHLHTDHYQGVLELAEKYRVSQIRTGLKAGDAFKVNEDITVTAIWPLSYNPNAKEKDENSNCSVFIINYKGYKIMVTGDLDEAGERAIIEAYSAETLKCDILKVGHHGSKFSSSDEFLDLVKPEFAVIQVGKNNYGHPAGETIDRLKNHGAVVLRTDLNGAVGFRFNANGIVYHTMID